MIRVRTFRTKHQESISYIVHIWVWGCGFVILLLVNVSAFCWQFFAPYFETSAPGFPCTIVIILYLGSSFPLGDTFVCCRWIIYVQNGLQLISQFALVSNPFHCHVALRSWLFWSYEVVQGMHDDQSDLVLSPLCKSFSVEPWRGVICDGRHSENVYFCRNAAVVPACTCKIWNLQFTASIVASHAPMSTKIAAQCHDAAFHFKVYISSFHSCHCSNSDKSLPRFLRVPGYHMSHLSIRLIQVWPS